MLKTLALIAVSQLAIALPQAPVLADEPPARIETVVGAGVKVKGNEGEPAVSVGLEVRAGDRIETDSKSAARVVYPDGTELMIGRDSQVQLHEGQWHTLEKGKIRAWIPKKKPAPKKKYRSGTRTRAAVMGVRGTEYLVEVTGNPSGALVSVLDGQVDVARNDADLNDGLLKRLSPGWSLQAGEGSPLADPVRMNRKQLLQKLQSEQPDLAAMGGSRARKLKPGAPGAAPAPPPAAPSPKPSRGAAAQPVGR